MEIMTGYPVVPTNQGLKTLVSSLPASFCPQLRGLRQVPLLTSPSHNLRVPVWAPASTPPSRSSGDPHGLSSSCCVFPSLSLVDSFSSLPASRCWWGLGTKRTLGPQTSGFTLLFDQTTCQPGTCSLRSLLHLNSSLEQKLPNEVLMLRLTLSHRLCYFPFRSISFVFFLMLFMTH